MCNKVTGCPKVKINIIIFSVVGPHVTERTERYRMLLA